VANGATRLDICTVLCGHADPNGRRDLHPTVCDVGHAPEISVIPRAIRLGPKGVDRVGDEDANAKYDQAYNSGLQQHRGDFHGGTSVRAALGRQTLLALGRPDGTPMVASLQICNPSPPSLGSRVNATQEDGGN
jgi:hypothetical protein